MQQPVILLVEDETVIASDIISELELGGFRVVTARDAGTALSLCRMHLPVAAILNFHFKAEMDGMELARLLRIQYLLPILFITGARIADLEASIHFYAGIEVLHKPFSRPQLKQFLTNLQDK